MKSKLLLFLFLCISLMLNAQTSKTLNNTAGKLSFMLTSSEKISITDLTITGTIDARDFKTIRDEMTGLASIDLSNAKILAYSGKDGTQKLSYNVTYYDNVFPQEALCNIGYTNDHLKMLIFPKTLVSLDDYCLRGCKAIESLELPLSVRYIGSDVFYDCASLRKINIPEGVTHIGIGSFFGCINLPSIKLPNSITKIESMLFCHCESLNVIEIPSSVTSIGEGAFSYCNQLFYARIPNSVTIINKSAFSNCPSMKYIYIPSSVDSIGDYAFMRCNAYLNVDKANLNYSSKDGMLYNKDQTKLIQCPVPLSGEIVIPESVVEIGSCSFNNCTQISSVSLPSSVRRIMDSAFRGCVNLETINMPDSITLMSHYCFGSTVSQNCDNLNSITIPNTVKEIGWGAFESCTGLTSIISKAKEPLKLTNSQVFKNVDKTKCILYVPENSIAAYKTSSQWSDFTQIVELKYINLSEDRKSVSESSSTFYLSISSNTDWSAKCKQDWLSLNKTEGNGNDSLLITIQPNIGNERSGMILFNTRGAGQKILVVTQSAGSSSLFVSSNFSFFSADDELLDTIRVTTNDIWTAVSDQSWITLSPATGDGNGTLILSATDNDYLSIRTACVLITTQKGIKQTVTIIQNSKSEYEIINLNRQIEIARNLTYPNPNNGLFTVTTTFEGESKLTITTLTGKRIFGPITFTHSTQVNLTGQPKGVYLCVVKNSNQVKTNKMEIK